MTRRILQVSQPITENDRMTRPFQEWQSLVTKLLPMTGSGSPEGVIAADQYQHYYDTAGSAGNILYIKMLSDVGGDKTQGWVKA